jgi:hypothetical protein
MQRHAEPCRTFLLTHPYYARTRTRAHAGFGRQGIGSAGSAGSARMDLEECDRLSETLGPMKENHRES